MTVMDNITLHSLMEEQPTYRVTHFMFFIAAVCFGISLFLPVFFLPLEDIDGYWVLLLGWLGIVFFQFAWYATPLMVWAIHLSAKAPRFSFLLAIAAILLASHAFTFTEIPVKEAQQQILGYGAGFYLWYSSFYIAALGLLYKLILYYGHQHYQVVYQQLAYQQRQSKQQMKRRERRKALVTIQPRTGVAKKVRRIDSPPPLPR